MTSQKVPVPRLRRLERKPDNQFYKQSFQEGADVTAPQPKGEEGVDPFDAQSLELFGAGYVSVPGEDGSPRF